MGRHNTKDRSRCQAKAVCRCLLRQVPLIAVIEEQYRACSFTTLDLEAGDYFWEAPGIVPVPDTNFIII
jgi:hypothetical protein